MVDVNDATNPVFVGCYSVDGYTHDVQCVIYDGPDSAYIGKEICFASNEDTITIVDVTVKTNPTLISKRTYQNDLYTHQGWLTEDHSHFLFNDELDEYYSVVPKTSTHVMDVRDLTNITYVGFYSGRTNAIDHNHYVKGEYLYQANYRAGFNILKINDVTNADFEEAGFFDIYPDSDSNAFNGAWSNYPYFPSGTIIVSGIEQGLFMLEVTGTNSCIDSGFPLSYQGNSVSCAQVMEDGACWNPVAASHCPLTCEVCNEYECENSLASWIINGSQKKCNQLSSFDPIEITSYCAQSDDLSTTCRGTCNFCE